MSNTDFITELALQLKARNNPNDFKEGVFGVVEQLSPLIVSIKEKRIMLSEGKELYVNEWFRFRCNINAELLSQGVSDNLSAAENVSETHSYTNSPCNMPNAIASLSAAISKVSSEVLKLKCNLAVGDSVLLIPMDFIYSYTLIDKVL